MTEEIPRVEVIAHRRRDGVWVLKVPDCPYCHGVHRHSGGCGDQPDYGFRTAHCSALIRDYELTPKKSAGEDEYV